jgi:hypothetical protein
LIAETPFNPSNYHRKSYFTEKISQAQTYDILNWKFLADIIFLYLARTNSPVISTFFFGLILFVPIRYASHTPASP